MQYLFVYGTLLSQYDKHTAHQKLRAYCSFVGAATLKAKLYMVDYYPGAVLTDENEVVKGELYEINDSAGLFDLLDPYEEYDPEDPENSEYIRKETEVILNASKKTYQAWVYLFNKSTDDLEYLPTGDFLNDYAK